MTQTLQTLIRSALPLVAAVVVSGCASQATLSCAPHDPWEATNRGLYQVSDAFDRVLLRPVAVGYRAITPSFVRQGVTNFSKNLTTPRSAINNFLQGKPGRGFTDLGRFLFNSTFGLGGLLDVATDSGMEEYDEDFGQTLAAWGMPDGPYVYLPILGPRTLRDAIVLPLDILADPLIHYENSSVRDRVYALRAINLRQRLFVADTLIEDSQDPYLSIREAYLQNRLYDIHDGDPPVEEDFYEDFDSDFEEPAANTDLEPC